MSLSKESAAARRLVDAAVVQLWLTFKVFLELNHYKLEKTDVDLWSAVTDHPAVQHKLKEAQEEP